MKLHEKQIATNARDNPKAFWSYINSKSKTSTRIPDIAKNGSSATTDQDKANVLNTFFTSVFTDEVLDEIPVLPLQNFRSTLDTISFTPTTIEHFLAKLEPDKAAGPDEIPPRLLKEAAPNLATPLSDLFTASMHTGKIPQDWRDGIITPIHKKGPRTIPGNYRPISLTAVISKDMESIIRKHLLQHLLENKLINQNQHGFIPGRSCLTNLLRALDMWTSAIEEGHPLDIAYMDFQKAFDSVPHQRLISKLNSYGISGNLLTWIEAFLSHRRQRVAVNNATSDWAPVTSGIPQGTVLGPILFVIFVNDLPNNVTSETLMFADDTKLLKIIKCDRDSLNFQSDLDRLHRWSLTWQLKFNPNKCKIMHTGRQREEHLYTMINDENDTRTILEETTCEKDLGLHVDNQLLFDDYIHQACKKASNVLRAIRRTFKHLDTVDYPHPTTPLQGHGQTYFGVWKHSRLSRNRMKQDRTGPTPRNQTNS